MCFLQKKGSFKILQASSKKKKPELGKKNFKEKS